MNTEALVILRQVKQQFSVELDYTSEANHLQEVYSAFQVAPEFKDKVAVPEPIPQLTSGSVIGMGYLEGPKLETALRARLQALGMDVGQQGIGDWIAAQQRHGITQNFGQEGSKSSEQVPSRGWGLGRWAVRLLGFDAFFWLTRKMADARSVQAPELHSALRLVLDVHGFQLFFCPVFNADPHPGNILMMPDGRIGLIDFGQCRRLSSEEKAGLARLLQAVTRPQSPEADREVAEAFEHTGVKSQHGDREFMALLPRLMFSRLQAE